MNSFPKILVERGLKKKAMGSLEAWTGSFLGCTEKLHCELPKDAASLV